MPERVDGYEAGGGRRVEYDRFSELELIRLAVVELGFVCLYVEQRRESECIFIFYIEMSNQHERRCWNGKEEKYIEEHFCELHRSQQLVFIIRSVIKHRFPLEIGAVIVWSDLMIIQIGVSLTMNV